jgi:hypothetical protein
LGGILDAFQYLKQSQFHFIMSGVEEISSIVKDLIEENDKEMASDPGVRRSMTVVEDFLRHHPVMCYGGTAINNLLPKKDRFYNPERDIPDYDFFSKTPQKHSKMVANQLAGVGVKNVEVRPGMHIGTFKVFADYMAVADITLLDDKIFDNLWNDSIVIDGIHYVPPNFLRMSMYLELSRPRGDVSRWEKVYSRLQLLNKHYSTTCPREKKEHEEITDRQQKEVENLLKAEPVVLLGVTAYEIHVRKNWTLPIMLLAEKDTIERLTKSEDVKVDEETEILPRRISVINEDGKSVIRFYETTACHSYHTMKNGIRVASIPTILQFFFAYVYSVGPHAANIASMLCIAQNLMDVASKKSKRRFDVLIPKDCLGKQETFIEMKRQKAELYEELSKNKSSPEFIKYFFSYNPHDKSAKKKTKTS